MAARTRDRRLMRASEAVDVRFAPETARNLRHRQARPRDVWHLDEDKVMVSGRLFWLLAGGGSGRDPSGRSFPVWA